MNTVTLEKKININGITEEEVPYMTKKEILAGFNDACIDIKLAREGKLQGRPIEDLFNEL
ncbi:hypothetical protein [uncultured Parabacteroides sp.]|uniref:hypothetical protein n=1 Tax=uncultured Parabacteroides sp. TaxID=512312 RepID=UPI0025E7C487|nr:hypothetical protein [uncultured Parabacteroides sp.]